VYASPSIWSLLRCMASAFAVMLTVPGTSFAEGADDVKFSATQRREYDSNLFRLSSTADAQALIGRSNASEIIDVTSVGLNYNKVYSLQRVQLDISALKYRYQNFGYLNFSAVNYSGAWRWSYTPHLYGNLTTTRDQSLNSFADFQGLNIRNERLNRTTRADAIYELDARWRLIGAFSRYAQTNTQPFIGESNYNQNSTEAGIRYVLASGSSGSYTLRSTNGNYENRVLPSASLLDTSFTQTDSDLQLTWAISRNASADFKVGERSRRHPNYPQRNFSGTTGNANLNWAISAKSTLVAGWVREIGAYETVNTNYSQTNRLFIGPVWRVSPKATVRLRLEQAYRNYEGPPTTLQGGVQRRDITRDTTLSLDWQPLHFLVFNASLQNARRSSSLPGLDFRSNLFNVTATLTY
jgi:exopolysaccharide biosynthesis operon protein EpsL